MAPSSFPVHQTVNLRDFGHPAAAIRVFQLHHLLRSPVKVIRNEGYLPVELVQGVAKDPPEAGASGRAVSMGLSQ